MIAEAARRLDGPGSWDAHILKAAMAGKGAAKKKTFFDLDISSIGCSSNRSGRILDIIYSWKRYLPDSPYW